MSNGSGVPVPRPPKPGPPRRAAVPGPPPAITAAAPRAVSDEAALKAAAAFGRVDDEGAVWVKDGDAERNVGQYPDATADAALAYFARKFVEIESQVALFETRIEASDLSIKEIDSTLHRLSDLVKEPMAVGNLATLRERVSNLRSQAATKRKEVEERIRAAKTEAAAQREKIVTRAETLAGRDPEKMQWRQAGDELRSLLTNWKSAQSTGPRIDRATEEELWKRFSHARTVFDRKRRHFFAALEERNQKAKVAKEAIVKDAERLALSTDWGPTSGAFRELMARWREAGHAGRKDDDALWAAFRAAQDQFFEARSAANAEIDAEYGANLEEKLKLLDEAERLLPIKNLKATKQLLRSIQERWDNIGRVPRSEMHRVESRLKAVEHAVREADEEQWQRSNPETKARVEGATTQLEATIAALEADLAKAQESGNSKEIAEVEQSLKARREWLEQIQRSAGSL